MINTETAMLTLKNNPWYQTYQTSLTTENSLESSLRQINPDLRYINAIAYEKAVVLALFVGDLSFAYALTGSGSNQETVKTHLEQCGSHLIKQWGLDKNHLNTQIEQMFRLKQPELFVERVEVVHDPRGYIN